MTTTLQSDLFEGDSALQAAADRDAGHVIPGAFGDHVVKIQVALLLLTAETIDNNEFLNGQYGHTTADAVLAYKTDRVIINRSYQEKADNIVGKMTMAKLDEELRESELARLLCAASEGARIEG